MRRTLRCRSAGRLLAAAAALVALHACDHGASGPPPDPATPAAPVAPDDPEQPEVPETPAPGAPETRAWQLTLTRPADLEGPRMAEVLLRRGDGLRFTGSEPGLAAVRAGKRVVVQERPAGLLRLVVFAGSNMALLDSGPLASLTFEATGSGPDTLELLYDRSAFAPSALYPRPETLQLQPLEATP